MGPRGYAREAILSVSSVELVAAIVVISRGLDASIVDRNGPCKSLWLGYFVDREVEVEVEAICPLNQVHVLIIRTSENHQ